MATTVANWQISAFTVPQPNDALDANVVRGNDNTVGTAHNNHDADPGLHLQSSVLASRPAAGTTGRKWMTTDAGSIKLWYDTGSVWSEISYVPTTGNVNIVGNLDVSGNFSLGGALISNLFPDATASNYNIGASGQRFYNGWFSNTVTANLFSGSGASLTALNASNVASGTLNNARLPAAISVDSLAAINGQITANRATATGATGATAVSFATANHRRITLSGNVTVTLSGAATVGGVYTLEIIQDSGTARTVTWANAVWANGLTPTMTTTLGRKDIYTFFYDGSNYCGVVFGQNFVSAG